GIAALDERARPLARYRGALDADPATRVEVAARREGLKRLCKRHGTDLAGVLKARESIIQELSLLENRQGALEVLMTERGAASAKATERARALSTARRTAAEKFSTLVQGGLAHLAMGKAEFSVTVSAAPKLGSDGQDVVEFFFTANPGEPARPLSRVASGGEASRVLLSLKRALAGSDHCATYVLDEADAGVGGAVAEVVGQMIKEVSAHRQVLCITHLPQVAAYADTHLFIHKKHQDGRTVSRVAELEGADARKRELARMLSGVELTREALGAAEALVRSANRSLKGVLRRAEEVPVSSKKTPRLRQSA
ncbi:MAG: DNA repair protein RecN, partial [Myxococcaceae bacterium]